MQPADPPSAQSPHAAVGARIAQRRRALGLSEHDLAPQLDLAPEALAWLEAGQATVTLELLTNAARALETTAAALLGEPGASERFLLGLDEADVRDLLEAFGEIRAPDVREAIVALVREMAATDEFRRA